MTDPDTISADYTLRPSELAETLALLVEARQPAVVWGPPGSAKSDIAQQVAATARSKPPRAMRTSRATPSRNPLGGSPPASTPTFCRRYNSGYLSHVHACFVRTAGDQRRTAANSINSMTFWRCQK